MPKGSISLLKDLVEPSTYRPARSWDMSAIPSQKGMVMQMCVPEPRVLIIDDDSVTRQVTEAVLAQAGYRVEALADGRQALRWLETRCAAIVITDIFMPDVDGLEIVRLVRRRCPAARVLVMSGGSHVFSQDYLPIAERLGADGTLTKPFRPADLLAAVARLADRDEPSEAVA